MPVRRQNRKAGLKGAASATSTKSTRGQPVTSISTSTSQSTIWGDSARATSTHVFFYGGHLSNWHLGPQFRGCRAFDLLLPELARLNLLHPPTNTFTFRLIQDHNFNCGEQWMMAMKAWFFETDLSLGNQVVTPTVAHDDNDHDANNGTRLALSEQQFRILKPAMYTPQPNQSWPLDSPERKMWRSALCQMLRAHKPREQKALGRQVRGFDETVWSGVNMACVVAACVARAEVDPVLRQMYLESEKLAFVEGSPRDVIWGVGVHWKSQTIEDLALWNGENRLGVCHDRAAEKMRKMVCGGGSGFEADAETAIAE